MPAEPALLGLPAAAVHSFAYVLARVSGAIAFVPIPGFRNAPSAPKIVLVLALTIALLPVWPQVDANGLRGPWQLQIGWLFAEAGFGLTIGVVLAWLVETFVVAMQVLGLQAGYAYASTIDPATQADSTTLQVLAQLTASLMFVVSGLDREVLRVFARSLEVYPPGSFHLTLVTAEAVVRFTGSMLAMSVRLALPLVALLIMVDIALALLGRINASLQLLTLAFPAKMLVAMLVLATLTAAIPSLFQEGTSRALQVIWGMLGQPRR